MTQAQSELSKLNAKWDERDRRYSARKIKNLSAPLTDSEADSVRAFRRSEIDDLPGDEKALARRTLERWMPPTVMR